MNIEAVEYFQKFYSATLEKHIHDPHIKAEWNYFCKIVKEQPFDRERIDLYLNVLKSEQV